MKTITIPQIKYIADIEKNLGVKYKGGDSSIEALKFIQLHSERNTQFNIDHNVKLPMTDKQKRFIKGIEAILQIEFNGRTLEEAKKFIERYKSEFYKTKRIMARTTRYVKAKYGY